MRFYSREPGDSGWAPLAIVMSIAVAAMLLCYFLWYVPSQTVAVSPTHQVIVNTPAAAPVSPTVIVPASPGPAGAPGPAGPSGAPGAPGAQGSPGTPGAPAPADPTTDPTDNSKKDGDK